MDSESLTPPGIYSPFFLDFEADFLDFSQFFAACGRISSNFLDGEPRKAYAQGVGLAQELRC